MALRIAAGADPLGIVTNHGVNDNQPMVNFWMVIDTIHKSSQMDIQFPTSRCKGVSEKKKFGLNMQAVCDAQRRFLWVDIRYPGMTIDFFAFDQSSLRDKLDQPGFLRSGLCLFGDAASANSPYMCSPFRSATGTQDGFNFFRVNCVNVRLECLSIDLEYFGRRFQ
eukprot:scaffold538_cov127-Alexandrium_tamarense.AAC.1